MKILLIISFFDIDNVQEQDIIQLASRGVFPEECLKKEFVKLEKT